MTKHTRDFKVTDARAAADDRRVNFSVSSTAPVQRGRYIEILDHSAGAVDLSWIGSGRAPLLLGHDQDRQVGVVERVSLDRQAGKLRAQVRFSKNPEADAVLADMLDGVRGNVSIGYSIERTDPDGDTIRVTRWKPLEVSIVSVPADMTVGVGRNAKPTHTRTEHMSETIEHVAGLPTGKPSLSARDAMEIMSLGQIHGMTRQAQKAIEDNVSFADFAASIRREMPTTQPIQHPAPALMQSQQRQFDLGNFVRARLTGDYRDAGYEREISQELSRKQRGARGAVVPVEAFVSRAALVTGSTAAPLVSTEHRPDLFVDSLRPASFAVQSGVTVLSGLTSDVSIPRETSAPTASWVAESGAISEGNPGFDNISLSANLLAARTSFSRQAAMQGLPQLDDLMRRSIMRQKAAALDAAVVAGSGSGAEPEGIENTTGINTFAAATAGAVTWSEIVDAWSRCMSDDVQPNNSMAWLAHPDVAKILRETTKDAGSGQFILGDRPRGGGEDGGLVGGTILGANCFESSHVTSSKLVLGKMSDVYAAQFGQIDIVFDEVSQAANGEIVIWAYSFWDVAVRHPESFCAITGI